MAGPRYVSPVTGAWADNASNLFVARRNSTRGERYHSGNDLHAAAGSKAYATIGGTVIYTGKNSGYGWNAVVQGDDGNLFRYATHGPLAVEEGQRVEQGGVIGTIAAASWRGAPHLHFEVIPPNSPAYQTMVANPGTFVNTQWYPGGKPLSINPAVFFGVQPGTQVTAGQEIGTDPAGMQLAMMSFNAAQQPRETIAAIQRDLAEQGVYEGPIDGIWGRGTQAGFEQFAASSAGLDIRQSQVAASPAGGAGEPSQEALAWQAAAPGATPPTTPPTLTPEEAQVAGMLLTEGGGEGREGMQSIANVMANRAADTTGRFPDSVIEQLTAQPEEWAQNPIDINNPPESHKAAVADAIDLAKQVVAGTLPDITNNAKYFYNPDDANPDSVASMQAATAGGTSTTRGNHVFLAEAQPEAQSPTAITSATDIPDIAIPASAPAPPSETVADVEPAVFTRPLPDQPPASYTPFTEVPPESYTPFTQSAGAPRTMPTDDPWAGQYGSPRSYPYSETGAAAFAPVPNAPITAIEPITMRPMPSSSSGSPLPSRDVYARKYGTDQREIDAGLAELRAKPKVGSPITEARTKDDVFTPPKPAPPIDLRPPAQTAPVPTPVSTSIDVTGEAVAPGAFAATPPSGVLPTERDDDRLGQGGFTYFNPFQPLPERSYSTLPEEDATVTPIDYTKSVDTPVVEKKSAPTPSVVPADTSTADDNPDKPGLFGRLFGKGSGFPLNVLGIPGVGGDLVGGLPGLVIGQRNGGLFSFGQGPQVFRPGGPSGTSPVIDGKGGYQYKTGTGIGGGFAGQYTTSDGRTITYTESPFGQSGYMTGYSR